MTRAFWSGNVSNKQHWIMNVNEKFWFPGKGATVRGKARENLHKVIVCKTQGNVTGV